MKKLVQRLLTPNEKSVKKRLEAWREKRPTKVIPKDLWQDIVSLVPKSTLNRISKIMRLNYTDLKRNYQKWESHTTSFVELTTMESTFTTEQTPLNTTIEMVLQNGCQITIQQQSSCESIGNIFSTVWKELQCSK